MAVRHLFLCAAFQLAAMAAQAQVSAPAVSKCPAPPALDKTATSVGTSIALQAAKTLLAQLGFNIDYRATRDVILADHPQADQMVVMLNMSNILCEMIWSDTKLSGGEKAAQYTKMMLEIRIQAAGPTPLVKTGTAKPHKQSRAPIGLALASWRSDLHVAQAEPELFPTPVTTGFLRDPPLYINDGNKYFVIVASVRSEESGRKLIKKLKAKAPQHDFALYAPYGNNSYYGIMMASWVPKDVATKALAQARKDVEKGAYLWSCKSTGQKC